MRTRDDDAHNYHLLIRRWKKIARACGLDCRTFATAADLPLLVLRSTRPPENAPRIYLSAGIHGDEPAATEGLVRWAAGNPAAAATLDLTIFPCLNPWGLLNNSRLDHRGRDLNRCYNSRTQPVAAHIRELRGHSFDLALTLHEDFDAKGIYIYEVPSQKPHWAESLLAAAAPHIPPDSRPTIESRRAKAGVIRRTVRPDTMPEWPEAFLLHFHHARRTFTIETPSEFHIHHRILAQIAVIQKAVTLACASSKTNRIRPGQLTPKVKRGSSRIR